MRILIATARRNLLGGVEKYLQTVIPGLIERGHTIGLLYEYRFNPSDEAIDSRAARLPVWCLEELGLDALLHSLQDWTPDVVYSHGLDDTDLERALLDTFPVMLYAHTYYGTCVSGRKCHAVPRLQPCGRRLGAGCLVLYYPRRCGGLHPGTLVQLFQTQSRRRVSLGDHQGILVASRHMYRELEQHGVSARRLHLVPLHTTDSVPATVPPSPRLPQGRILFVGRLVDVKGADYLLSALPHASKKLGRSLALTVAGDGPDRAKLEGLARQLNVEVEFAGWVGGEQKMSLMRDADLVAVPSLWPEPFGLVGIEAGCLGTPAVGYAVGGIPDWLIPGRTGELAPGDPPAIEGLAAAIVRALCDPIHYQQLRLGAWEAARQYTLERHLESLERVLSVQCPAGAAQVLVSPDPQVRA